MNKQSTLRLGIAGAVAASGLTVGGVAIAQAADTTPAAPQGAPDGQGPRGPGGPGGLAGPEGGAALAKKLGVSESKLEAALKTVREDLRPDQADKPAAGEKPDPADRPDRSEHRAKLAKALAKELGISEAKVTAAFESIEQQRSTERRSDLSSRLDTAVKAGKLSADDKKSVLKAYDAGVLGGPAGR